MKATIIDIEELTDSRELIERKTPKYITIFLIVILVIIITFLIWATISEIDEYSTVSGEIRPEESVSMISTMGSGKIQDIKFKNGDKVNAGDVILTIDVEAANNQKDILTNTIEKLNKEITYNEKLKQCIENDKNTFSQTGEESKYYKQYEKYENDLSISLSEVKNTDNQNTMSNEQANITLRTLRSDINKNNQLILEYENIIKAIEENSDFTSNNDTIMVYYENYILNLNNANILVEKYKKAYEDLLLLKENGVTQNQIDEAKIQWDSASSQKESVKSTFLLEVNQKIDSLKTEISSLEESVEKTNNSLNEVSEVLTEEQVIEQAKLNMVVSINSTINSLENTKMEYDIQLLSVNEEINNSTVKSEISGEIMYYNDFSEGDTIQGGTQIAKIIPSGDKLKTILYITDSDISNIKIGQSIEYTVTSISSVDYGKVYGKITNISADSFIDESNGMVYYKAEGTLDLSSLTNLSGDVKNLKTGMTVEAHIISGSKKIIIWCLEQLNFIS